MTKYRKSHLTYALNHNGDLVHIDSVPNGNECACYCPFCKSELCAKNGGDTEKKAHHFAHLGGADCVSAIESALHKMAKDILKETMCLQLPSKFYGVKGDILHFDRVEVEFYDKDTCLRPDCICYYGEKCLWVEFKRTHAVDAKKKGKIISAHVDCVEIDLCSCILDPEEVKKFITCSDEHRIWIRNTELQKNKRNYPTEPNYERQMYYNERLLRRTFAKDENGQFVNLRNNDFDMNCHSYFCLACGKELTIDVDESGNYSFVHLEENLICMDDLYLHEATKEALLYKFENEKQFIIQVPQYQNCNESPKCKYYSQYECLRRKEIPYDLKKFGYTECIKEYQLPGSRFKCDLVLMQADSMDGIIVISIIAGECFSATPTSDIRIIELYINSDDQIDNLLKNQLSQEQCASFINFKNKTNGSVPQDEINREIYKFSLFSSGKWHFSTMPCSRINERKRSTIYEMIFVNAFSREYCDIEYYSLLKCFKDNRKACYCDLCMFLAKSNWSKSICKRYKTVGTPHYPFDIKPINCPYFCINNQLVEQLMKKCDDMKIIEREFKENSDY